MPFRFEREMTLPAEEWLRLQGMEVKREFATPWGVCDLVAARLSQRKVRARLKLGQRNAIGPPLRIAILMQIPDANDGKAALSLIHI